MQIQSEMAVFFIHIMVSMVCGIACICRKLLKNRGKSLLCNGKYVILHADYYQRVPNGRGSESIRNYPECAVWALADTRRTKGKVLTNVHDAVCLFVGNGRV